ncbi:hypothetical protein [Sphingomonas sp.]|uniref:hypothetical protein n=1 Tax=Sphingomonas sp. TaxID=28214 RepID=UPI001EB3E468|nr:hypothetical protein [Sphingomonas sp.]MBX3595499.1 DUF3052 family protein [Sphingomonas sp.]
MTGDTNPPLCGELDLKPGMRVFILGMPDTVRDAARIDSSGLEVLAAPSTGIDAAHLFVQHREELMRELKALRQLIAPTGFIWVSWPANAAPAESDVTADAVRDVALPLGLSDVKACAIDDLWSGLKLMVCKESRAS